MKTTKAKQPTKLDQLVAQGRLLVGEIDGQKVPYFAMPTDELQSELSKQLEKKIKKHLKDSGFERITATRRDHPFHSDILRKRIDGLAELLGGKHYDPTLDDEAGREEYTQTMREILANVGLSEEEADASVASDIQKMHREWAKGFEKYRNMLRDLNWWKGTYVYRAIFPEGRAAIPDGYPPKPVYVNKRRPDLVIQLLDGFVYLYAKVELTKA